MKVSGNHIGIVVNSNDPESRCRVQIFIPHLSNTIYKNWNEDLTDITFKTFEESIFQGEVKEQILSTLPWAEPAALIWGGGTGAPVTTDTGQPTPIPTDQSLDTEEPVEPDLPPLSEGGSVEIPENLPPDQMPMWDDSEDPRVVEENAGVNNTEGKFDGETTTLGSGGIAQDSEGLIDPQDMKKSVLAIIKGNPQSIYNNPNAPINGERYGITGGAESWANFWTKAGSYESSYNNNTENRNDPGGSFGILQVGPGQIGGKGSWGAVYPDLARSYGIDPYRTYNEYDILSSADFAIRSKLFVGDAIMRSSKYGGYRVGIGESNGLGSTIGKATWDKIENNAPLAAGSSSDSKQVFRLTSMGVGAVGSVNGSRVGGPMGSFSTPRVGAKVWVFFHGDNIQRPVYFANVYESGNAATVN